MFIYIDVDMHIGTHIYAPHIYKHIFAQTHAHIFAFIYGYVI